MKKYNIDIKDSYTDRGRINFINASIESADKLIIFTESQLDTYSKRYSKEFIHYSEAFVEPNYDSFQDINITKNEKFTFCYVAHTVWLKGLTYLLTSWQEAGLLNAKLRIAGTIDSKVRLYINQNFPLLQNVEFCGPVQDLNKFFRSSHVCIVPSLLDAGPATVAESLYCKLPVICTDGCGSKTLINDSNGLVVPSGSVEHLTKALFKVFDTYDEFEFELNSFDICRKNHNKQLTKFYSDVSDLIVS